MNPLQSAIDFSYQPITVHSRENNAACEANLNEHKDRYISQAQRIFNAMMNGQETSSDWGIDQIPRIKDFIRRKSDLLESGVLMSEKPDGHGGKIFYMTSEQISYNQKFLTP